MSKRPAIEVDVATQLYNRALLEIAMECDSLHERSSDEMRAFVAMLQHGRPLNAEMVEKLGRLEYQLQETMIRLSIATENLLAQLRRVGIKVPEESLRRKGRTAANSAAAEARKAIRARTLPEPIGNSTRDGHKRVARLVGELSVRDAVQSAANNRTLNVPPAVDATRAAI